MLKTSRGWTPEEGGRADKIRSGEGRPKEAWKAMFELQRCSEEREER